MIICFFYYNVWILRKITEKSYNDMLLGLKIRNEHDHNLQSKVIPISPWKVEISPVACSGWR